MDLTRRHSKKNGAMIATKKPAKRKKVVIIGAGPGGLTTALQLAQAGQQVTLVEARERVGGRSSAIEANGFRFDTGPTFFLYPRVLQEIFAEVGRDLFAEVPMKKLDPQYRISFGGGGRLDCTPDLERMEAQVAAFSPADAGALTRYMRDNRVKLAKFRPILESAFNSPIDLLRPSLMAAAPYVKPWKSLGQELESYFRDPRLVLAFSFQAKYLGMSPFRCPSLFSILSFLEYEHGIFHPLGGCARVNERMAEIAVEMGVELKLQEPVEKIHFEGRRAMAVQTPAATYGCDALVINSDFAHTMQRLVPNHLRKRWSDEKLEQKRFSCSTFMMYLGIEGRYPDVAHHTIHISKDYARNLREIEEDKVLPEDPSVYIHNPSLLDPSLAPTGMSSLYVLVPHLSPQTPWDAKQMAAYRELTLDRLEALGLDGLRSRIRYEKIVTPLDWRDSYAVYRGATFNLAHNLGQMLHRRPHNRFEELDGVYLVGGGTHPGSGLPVIYESSRITSRQLLSSS
jgi:phytoene desaturase